MVRKKSLKNYRFNSIVVHASYRDRNFSQLVLFPLRAEDRYLTYYVIGYCRLCVIPGRPCRRRCCSFARYDARR